MEDSISHFEHSFARFSKGERKIELESAQSEEETNIAKTPWLYWGGWQKAILIAWLIGGLLVVAGVFTAVYLTSINSRQSKLEQKCESWANSIEKSFNESRSHIFYYRAVLNIWSYQDSSSTPALNQEKFLEFSLLTKETRPLVIGVAYLSRVLHKDRDKFEKEQGWEILDYFLRRQENRSEYAPVMFSDLSFPLIARADSWAGKTRK
jgi:CHASE1-domain containing sensor protein